VSRRAAHHPGSFKPHGAHYMVRRPGRGGRRWRRTVPEGGGTLGFPTSRAGGEEEKRPHPAGWSCWVTF